MIKDHILQLLKKSLATLQISVEQIQISNPTHESFGDYSTSIAMQLSKQMQKSPLDIAKKIVDNLPDSEKIERVDVVKPGFINFWLAKETLMQEAATILDNADDYGKTDMNADKTVIVEYSSPNIAKPFTIGHLRSTIIGHTIANLLEATGYTVYRDNHVGDWGTQFGKQIYAIKTWGNEKEIGNSERPIKELVKLYIKFHEESEQNPELENEGRKWFKKLEDGDEKARELWDKCIEWSWKEFEQIYNRLDVSFTENNGRGYGESFFEDKMIPVLEELEKHDFYKESKGAKLVFFKDDKYPPLMIVKQDGATLYATRDLAADKFRLTNKRYTMNNITIINEVGIEQSLYFQQLYETEQMLGWVKEGQRVHVKHGMYRFKDKKMSTRKGNVIWLEDVLDEAIKHAKQLGKETNSDDIAEAVGIGAIKWNDLKRSSHLDMVFDWEEILNMQGNSGPYIQYTYVRCLSVLKQAGHSEQSEESSQSRHPERHGVSESVTISLINDDERTILAHLLKFPEVVQDAAENVMPHIVTTYLFELAQKYNLFYQKYPILKAKEQEKNIRLLITKATAQVLKNGLHLLGIKTVKKM